MFSNQVLGAILSFAFALTAFAAPTSPKGGSSFPEIHEAFYDAGQSTLTIIGDKFDPDLVEVRLGDADSAPLPFFTPPVSDDVLVVDVTGVTHGDYTMTVSQGGEGNQSDQFDLTIGAVGPAGADGAIGPEGPPGLSFISGINDPPYQQHGMGIKQMTQTSNSFCYLTGMTRSNETLTFMTSDNQIIPSHGQVSIVVKGGCTIENPAGHWLLRNDYEPRTINNSATLQAYYPQGHFICEARCITYQ